MGTAWTVLITAATAYPLSRKDYPFKRLFTAFILSTTVFDAGLIPNYLLRRDLGLLEKRLVLILPGLTAWNTIIVRSFLLSTPFGIQG